MKKIFSFFFLLLLLFPIVSSHEADTAHNDKVIIYKNEACGHCNIYLDELIPYLTDKGFQVEQKNLINDAAARTELDSLIKEQNIPPEFQGHMVTIVNKLILEGHVPIKAVKLLLEKYPDFNFPKLILYQDSMGEVESYTALNEDNKIAECSADEDPVQCLEQKGKKDYIKKSLLYLVIFQGLLSGIHPCTITVLLLFIAFLFTIKKTKGTIFKVGLAFIIGVFLAYFLIGLGVLKAFVISAKPHISAQIGALLILLLGLLNLYAFFFKKNIGFGIPSSWKSTISEMMHKASVPTAFIVGIIVGICSFGCTAGIYLSVISLLLMKATYLKGFVYLILYNIMFIAPLLVILFAASTPKVVERLETWESSEKRYIRLISGIVMILSAILIYYIVARPM